MKFKIIIFKRYKTCTWMVKFQDELFFGDQYHTKLITKNNVIKELQSKEFTVFKGNEEWINRRLENTTLIAENYIPQEDFINALQG